MSPNSQTKSLRWYIEAGTAVFVLLVAFIAIRSLTQHPEKDAQIYCHARHPAHYKRCVELRLNREHNK
jgi:hypothetical protein